MNTISFPGAPLEVLDIPGDHGLAPLVLMHGGLGSAQLWDEFRPQVAAATGRRTVAFSRHGHGWSARPPKPRTPRFMHEEARTVVPMLLERLELDQPVLIGHSDGASIALIHAAQHQQGPLTPSALVTMAPHLFVEEKCVSEIARVREQYQSGDLREKMAPHHADVDAAFFGWSDVWLDPEFRAWDIRELVARIEVPILAIQGLEDQFGTLAQLDELERLAQGPVQRLHLDCRHAPFVQRTPETVAAVCEFVEARLAV
jgi:pimeloyl-ACP methyl ester carboxylesterase